MKNIYDHIGLIAVEYASILYVYLMFCLIRTRAIGLV